MALTVNTNNAAKGALTNLNQTNRKLTRTLSRISSGKRVESAADDAAGLAVAENLDAAERSLRAAMRNTNDGISVIQTAESSTAEVGTILKRLRELAVQSASDTLATTERSYIEDEFLDLSAEIDRIANVTEFNGVKLSDGSLPTVEVQVGINDSVNDRIPIPMSDLRAVTLGVDTAGMSLLTSASSQLSLVTLDDAIDTVNSYRSDFGAAQNRLESSMRNLENYTENLASAESQIRDADFAYESAELSKFQIMQQAGTAILAQANGINQSALQLINN